MNQSTDPKTQIHKCLQYLAGVCDYAAKKDDCGFNAFDAAFGHDLANRPSLSDTQALTALKMMKKYTRQLSGAGLELPEFTLSNENLLTVKVEQYFISLSWERKPKQAIINSIKLIPGRRYADGTWYIPFDQFEQLVKIIPQAETVRPQVLEAISIRNTPPTQERAEQPAAAPSSQADVTLTLNGKLVIKFGKGSPHFQNNLAAVKGLCARKYDPETYTWSCPERLAKELIAKLHGNVQMSDNLKAKIEQQSELTAMSNRATSDFNVQMKGGELLPFQRAGVEFADKANRCLIADEMGLGKTIQALAYLQLHPELRPAVIVVPASLKINWQREADKWLLTHEKIYIASGRTPVRGNGFDAATIIVINYDILTDWVEPILSRSAKVLIVDEAHYLKNPKALRSENVKRLSKKIEKVIFLTGTPVVNRPRELWTLLNMIDDQNWSNFFRFAMRYCDAHHNGFGYDFSGASNLDELHQAVKQFCIRRTKDQVLKELPSKRRATVTVEFDKAARQEYEDRIQAYLDQSSGSAQQLVEIEAAKQAAVKGKLAAAIEWIESFIETDKLVVFATHNLTVDTLMDKFGTQAVKVTGDVTGKDRQAAVDRFQNDPACTLFVGNIKAAGVGLTLTAASNAAFLEFGWTPGEMTQAEDRIHRIGQDYPVTIWYLCADGTIDEDIISLLESKRQVVDKITDGKVNEQEFNILHELHAKILAKKGK